MEKVPCGSATRALALEYKSLQDEPVEGFRVKLVNDDNLFEWEVAIFGPPETLYQGAYFKAHMKFPHDYPYSPPSIKFLTKVWHPNVYEVSTLFLLFLLNMGWDANRVKKSENFHTKTEKRGNFSANWRIFVSKLMNHSIVCRSRYTRVLLRIYIWRLTGLVLDYFLLFKSFSCFLHFRMEICAFPSCIHPLMIPRVANYPANDGIPRKMLEQSCSQLSHC